MTEEKKALEEQQTSVTLEAAKTMTEMRVGSMQTPGLATQCLRLSLCLSLRSSCQKLASTLTSGSEKPRS